VFRYRPLDSARLYLDLVDTRKRLLNGLAEEREAHAISAGTPGDAATRDHWQTVRSQVERGAGCYAMAIGNYTEALLSDLGDYLPVSVVSWVRNRH
jgi:hypothetical protein